MEEERGVYGVVVGNLRKRDQWGDPGIGGRVDLHGSSGSGMWG
jgi:hypothetical protein